MDHPLTVVGCFAHPDDETWVMSGSLALLAARGARCAIWTATRGEAGQIAAASGVPRERLGEVREAEERAAMALVGVHEVEFGGYPDGAVADADQAQLVLAIHAFLERLRPDVVVTMEPAGVTAHPDHMAVSSATTSAFAAYAEAAEMDGRQPRLYHEGAPSSRLERWRELSRGTDLEPPDEDKPFGFWGIPDERFTCHVDVSPVTALRAAALREHRTQLDISVYAILGMREDVLGEVLGVEDYIRVHPAPRLGEPHETSLVEAFIAGATSG